MDVVLAEMKQMAHGDPLHFTSVCFSGHASPDLAPTQQGEQKKDSTSRYQACWRGDLAPSEPESCDRVNVILVVELVNEPVGVARAQEIRKDLRTYLTQHPEGYFAEQLYHHEWNASVHTDRAIFSAYTPFSIPSTKQGLVSVLQQFVDIARFCDEEWTLSFIVDAPLCIESL